MLRGLSLTGYFISFEGVDGSGKSTQIKNLAHSLAMLNYDEPVITREPGGTIGADILRHVFLHHKHKLHMDQALQYLFMIGARADHIDELIKPALEQGKIVLSDRYADSTAVYQDSITSASHPHLYDVGQSVAHSCMPNLTLVLDIEPQKALERIKKRKDRRLDAIERTITLEIIEQRRAAYLQLAARDDKRCYVVDAMQSVEKVKEEITAIVIEKLQGRICTSKLV